MSAGAVHDGAIRLRGWGWGRSRHTTYFSLDSLGRRVNASWSTASI